MRGEIEERTVRIAEYIAEKRCTVRQAAAVFCISKSTVHKDISERLPHVNRALSEDVRKILDENKRNALKKLLGKEKDEPFTIEDCEAISDLLADAIKDELLKKHSGRIVFNED